MKYGPASDLSGKEYKIFDIGSPLYVDTNGSGSGDQYFSTGSGFNSNPGYKYVMARYIQLKYTLRTNLTGSL